MKSIFEAVIRKGNYDLTGLLRRIDEYHIMGALSDNDRNELIAAARGDAEPGMDVKAEIQRLWAEIRKLNEKFAMQDGSADEGADENDVPEYRNPTGGHDAYYNGDLVKWQGKVYTCVAPEGVACVWDPDVMPAYWELL